MYYYFDLIPPITAAKHSGLCTLFGVEDAKKRRLQAVNLRED